MVCFVSESERRNYGQCTWMFYCALFFWPKQSQQTYLEQDEDEEQLVDDSNTKPEPPVSYKEREREKRDELLDINVTSAERENKYMNKQ